MLQFFDDLPKDRWAALLYVERHARQHHLSRSSSLDKRRMYVQMILVAAYELQLCILPEWQSESGLLYLVINLSDELFARFERDLVAAMPAIKSLADQGTALRNERQVWLTIAK